MNHELPNGWSPALLTDVVSVIRGVTYKKDDAIDQLSDGYSAVLRANNIQNGNLLLSDLVYVPDEKISDVQRIVKGDIVVAMSSGSKNLVGKSGLAKYDLNAAFGAFCGLLRPSAETDSRYIGYFSLTKEYGDRVSSLSKGVNINNLKPAHFSEISIPLAPLPEQIRIADKLDSVLARVNAAQSRLDKIPALIKRFRQSVLAAATSGELTQEWRDLNVKEGCSTTVLLGDISEVSTGVTPLKSNRSYYENGRIPWLTSSVTGDFYVRKSEKFITSKAVDECRLKLYPPGTLLMAMYGEGKTRGQVTEIKISATVNQACAAIQIISDSVSKEYVRLCLDDNYERTRMMAEGGAQPNLNLKKVRSIPINLPELDEQHEIVRRVESLFALADTVEKQYRDARARTDRLTQAILAKAFRGELVPQNPDDEPAEVLLKRIRQQRAEQATAGKRGKARKVSG